jgi:hypothetical protein
MPEGMVQGPEDRREVVEVTGEDMSVTITRAEVAAGVVSAVGMVSAGVSGTAGDSLGRTSDQAINQSH